MENYELELPEGYHPYKVIDAKKTSTAIIFNTLSFVLLAIACGVLFAIKKPSFEISYDNHSTVGLMIFIYMASIILYIVGHELVHGLFYKIFTKQKLTFGLSFSCAYCGVPQVYLRKWPAIIAALAPFTFFSIIFIPIILLMPANIYCFLLIILFGIHFGGCIGDLYVSFLMLFILPKDFLVNDNGAKQVFYTKEDQAC